MKGKNKFWGWRGVIWGVAGLIILSTSSLIAADKTADEPKKLNIVAIDVGVREHPWDACLIQAMERVKEERPHGLTINFQFTELVSYPDAERVLANYAKTGKYDIIWAHSAFSQAVANLCKKYPEILWVFAGSGNEPVGGNAYWVDAYMHEPAYLMGIIAGMMTESNVIGAVGAYPYPNINLPINAFRAGARSVNPDVKLKMSYTESWIDINKAQEAALAQIATGADFIYAERHGVQEACRGKGKYCIGHLVDQNYLAPEAVVSSSLALWDPAIKFIIDEWWNHVTKGTPYNAPMERIVYDMKMGGTDVAPYHGFEDKIHQEAKDAVKKAKQEIMEGTLVVPFNQEPVVSD